MKSKRRMHVTPGGTTIVEGKFRSRIWAPEAVNVDFCLYRENGEMVVAMNNIGGGWFTLDECAGASVGSRYHFVINGSQRVPDPVSRYNPDGVHGPSMITDPTAFVWKDEAWRGRPYNQDFIYEMHVGTFTAAGTFRAAQRHLQRLQKLGFTAIELMPLWECPGKFSWGYDGTLCYSVESQYGTPDDLKRFVQAAHALGISVYVDVVYNHFGPEGNYLPCYAGERFFNRKVGATPWGAAINFCEQDVRDFYVNNALYWLVEFNVDGLRFDAVHTLIDDKDNHVIDAIAKAIAAGPGSIRPRHLIAEGEHDFANRLLKSEKADDVVGFDGHWDDDFHNAVHVIATGDNFGYGLGDVEHVCGDSWTKLLGMALAQPYRYAGVPVNEYARRVSRHVPIKRGVFALQNHDQIGNRPFGDRLASVLSREALRAVTALHLLQPGSILCFQGEEFGYRGAFNFFCDLGPHLNQLVTDGRRNEFGRFPAFEDPEQLKLIPDPCSQKTFKRSKVDWSKRSEASHREMEQLYEELLRIRMECIVPMIDQIVVPQAGDEVSGPSFHVVADGILEVTWPLESGHKLLLFANLTGESVSNAHLAAAAATANCQTIYSTHCIHEGEQPAWSVTWLLI